jgi:hypothetical protein
MRFLDYAAAGMGLLLFRNGSYTSPLTHNRCNRTANFRAVAITARFFPFFPPRSAKRVRTVRMIRTLRKLDYRVELQADPT